MLSNNLGSRRPLGSDRIQGNDLGLDLCPIPNKGLFSWFYVAGVALVLSGLLLSSLMEIHLKKALKQKQSADKLQLKENGHTDIKHANGDGPLVL
jgi:hypothetical protein